MRELDPRKRTRAVVFHQGALGDFLMAASAIDELAENRNWERVDFWSKPDHVSLLTGKNYLGDCHSPDSAFVASILHDSLWKTATIPGFLLEADHVLIFGQLGSRLLTERLSARLPANVCWIQSFPAGNDTHIHVSDFLSRQLNDLGFAISGRPLNISPPLSEKEAAVNRIEGLEIDPRPIFVHPGSGGRHKVWPLKNWQALLHWIRRDLSVHAILSIGPADDYLQEFCVSMQGAGVSTVSGFSPLRLSALISSCGLYIGSDSGVSHLAAATGIPAIAVFGPTDPRVSPREECNDCLQEVDERKCFQINAFRKA